MHFENSEKRCPHKQKAAAVPTQGRIRWRLGWHGGVPLQPRGSVPPPFGGFTLGSVELVSLSMPTRLRTCFESHESDAFNRGSVTQVEPEDHLDLIREFGIACFLGMLFRLTSPGAQVQPPPPPKKTAPPFPMGRQNKLR